MKYEFPHITHLDQIRDAIAGSDEFQIIVKGDYSVVNYFINTPNTFPKVVTERDALRRECRGAIFCTDTGRILRRPYHKFFNLLEKDETQLSNVPFTDEHLVLTKLDGSMIAPFKSEGVIRWGTKMGVTEVALPAEAYARTHTEYDRLAQYCDANGLTPIFEWCSRKQRIVIDYPEDRLVLTAVRDMLTGAYLDLKNFHDFGVDHLDVSADMVTDVDKFLADTRALENLEGWVVRFTDGHMFKVKADQYCRMHKTLDVMNFEKEVVRLILSEKIDDTKPFMQDNDRKAVERFEVDLRKAVKDRAEKIRWVVDCARDNLGESKKRFALEVACLPEHEAYRSVLFQVWDGKDPFEQLVKSVLANCSSQTKLNEARSLLGELNWSDYRSAGYVE